MRAVNLGDTEIVKLLLARAADVNASDILDQTAFVFAYEKGNVGIEKLLQSTAPQQQTPRTVNAFLKTAIGKKDAAKVKEWLAKGADPNYQYPISYSHKEIKSTMLILAAGSGDASIVQMLLDKGANVNAKGLISGSERGLQFGTALEAAEFSQHPDVVLVLKKAVGARN